MSESNNIYETTCRFCGLAKYYGNYLFNDESVTADLLTKIELIFSPEVSKMNFLNLFMLIIV